MCATVYAIHLNRVVNKYCLNICVQYTWSNDRLWRKNRRKGAICNGVDLNRNYPDHWGGVSCFPPSGPLIFLHHSDISPCSQASTPAFLSLALCFYMVQKKESCGVHAAWEWGYILTYSIEEWPEEPHCLLCCTLEQHAYLSHCKKAGEWSLGTSYDMMDRKYNGTPLKKTPLK